MRISGADFESYSTFDGMVTYSALFFSPDYSMRCA